jgi:hypothetical protein
VPDGIFCELTYYRGKVLFFPPKYSNSFPNLAINDQGEKANRPEEIALRYLVLLLLAYRLPRVERQHSIKSKATDGPNAFDSWVALKRWRSDRSL